MKKFKNKEIGRLMSGSSKEYLVVCKYIYETYRRYSPKRLFLKKHIKFIYQTEAAYERKQVRKIKKGKIQPHEENSLFTVKPYGKRNLN